MGGDHTLGGPAADDGLDYGTGRGITVVGCGGGGIRAIDRMIAAGVAGVAYVVADTDAPALEASTAGVKIQLGANLTHGFGGGGNPAMGRQAAEEAAEAIGEALAGADLVFVIAGLGGGAGTGAAPVVARLARERDAVTLAVVSQPFAFEGEGRKRQAEQGLAELGPAADAVIAIPNERLMPFVDLEIHPSEAFRRADDTLRQVVQAIGDGLTPLNVVSQDFDDIRRAMTGMGYAVMGTGAARGDNRAVEATRLAMVSPLLEGASMYGAHHVLFNISGPADLKLQELHDAFTLVQTTAADDAFITYAALLDQSLGDSVKATLIVPGIRPGGRPFRRADELPPREPMAPNP